MPSKLSAAETEAALAKLEGWRLVDGREAIAKKFQFADFRAAASRLAFTAGDR